MLIACKQPVARRAGLCVQEPFEGPAGLARASPGKLCLYWGFRRSHHPVPILLQWAPSLEANPSKILRAVSGSGKEGGRAEEHESSCQAQGLRGGYGELGF